MANMWTGGSGEKIKTDHHSHDWTKEPATLEDILAALGRIEELLERILLRPQFQPPLNRPWPRRQPTRPLPGGPRAEPPRYTRTDQDMFRT